MQDAIRHHRCRVITVLVLVLGPLAAGMIAWRDPASGTVGQRREEALSGGAGAPLVALARATPSSGPAVSKRIEAELAVEPRVAAPGTAVRLRYMVSSYEDRDERVRLRVAAPPGWELLDAEIETRDLLLERWENLEGELYLLVPLDAAVGHRQVVRLIVDLVDVGGVIEAQDQLAVGRRGGAKPGVPTIAATTTVGLARLGVGGLDGAQKAGAVTASLKFGKHSTLSFFYDRGLRENLSNFRFEEQRTRVSGHLRHAGWDATFGNYVPSPGHTLAGPYVLGRGVSASRPGGALLADVSVLQPNTIRGEAGGHLFRGRAGVRTPRLLLAFNASYFGRPVGGYTTLAGVQQTLVDHDAEERLEHERRLTAAAAANRVTGLGVELELRPDARHRFATRAGGLWLSNAAGAVAGGLAAEASYAYASKRGAVNLRWRQTPPTVQGISIPGDEVTADGSLRVADDLRLVGHVYRNTWETIGADFSSAGQGGSLGVRFTSGARRLEIRANHRESEFTTRTQRRTVSVAFGMPFGRFSFSALADVGHQESFSRTDPIAFYRADVRWLQDGSTLTLGFSHSEGAGRRQRLDVIAARKLRAVEWSGGTWATRGHASGDRPGAWTSIGLPVGPVWSLIVGIDYSSPAWAAPASLRGMVAIRQGFAIPVPFVRGTPVVARE